MSIFFPQSDPDGELESLRESCDLGERCPRCGKVPTSAYPIVAAVDLSGKHFFECRNCDHRWSNYYWENP